MIQKFVVVVGGWWVCKPISVLSFDQAEQHEVESQYMILVFENKSIAMKKRKKTPPSKTSNLIPGLKSIY